MKIYKTSIIVMLLHCCSGMISLAQKSFTIKDIQPYLMPVYSFNKMGVEKKDVFDNHDLNGLSQGRFASGDNVNSNPGTVAVKNNMNFAAGLDYDMWLPYRFFFTVGAEFRTLNNKVRYDYNFDKYIVGYTFDATDGRTFTYNQRLNLLSFSLYLGKNFRISNNEFEVKFGASVPFNLNTINNYENSRGAWVIEQSGNSYLLPYTYNETMDANRERSFISENPRLHIYLGTDTKLNIFSQKSTKVSYGLQLNFVDGVDNELRFYSYYNYAMDGRNIYYKSQITKFSYSKVIEIGLKVGVNLY